VQHGLLESTPAARRPGIIAGHQKMHFFVCFQTKLAGGAARPSRTKDFESTDNLIFPNV
jgi:hypothetical protein